MTAALCICEGVPTPSRAVRLFACCSLPAAVSCAFVCSLVVVVPHFLAIMAPHVPLAATRNLRESGEPPMAIVAEGRPASPAELARSLISAQVVTKGDFLVLRDGYVPV